MYEIWVINGVQGDKVAECTTIKEALEYIKMKKNQTSFAIKRANGDWHEWTAENQKSRSHTAVSLADSVERQKTPGT